MPPKNAQAKEASRKKTAKKCPFNNRGYCKRKESCENQHSEEVCNDLDCNEDGCNKRHPTPCKFSPRCQFNRRQECFYLHVTLTSDDGKIEALNQLNNNMVKMQKDIEKKDSEIKLLTTKFTTLETEKDINPTIDLKKDIECQNATINGLEIRLEELEKENKRYKKQQEKKIKELENLLKLKPKKAKDNETTSTEENSFKCRKCNYTTTSRQGLKIQNAKVHSTLNFDEFPAACDICEKVLDNETKLKKHKKTEQTFHACLLPKKQCGLCDKVFDNSRQLDEHLSTCEIFVCDNSGCRE